MSEAMKQMREALGEEAIIVSSTREEQSGWVKITAAVEQHNPPAEKEEHFDAETNVEIITEVLLKHRVPAGVSDKIISVLHDARESDPQENARYRNALKKGHFPSRKTLSKSRLSWSARRAREKR